MLLCWYRKISTELFTSNKSNLCDIVDKAPSLALAISWLCFGSDQKSFCRLGRLVFVTRDGCSLLVLAVLDLFLVRKGSSLLVVFVLDPALVAKESTRIILRPA